MPHMADMNCKARRSTNQWTLPAMTKSAACWWGLQCAIKTIRQILCNRLSRGFRVFIILRRRTHSRTPVPDDTGRWSPRQYQRVSQTITAAYTRTTFNFVLWFRPRTFPNYVTKIALFSLAGADAQWVHQSPKAWIFLLQASLARAARTPAATKLPSWWCWSSFFEFPSL